MSGSAETYNILQYDPSKVGAGIFGAVYLILAAIFAFHTIRGKSFKEQWGSCLYIGCIFSALGWLLRIPFASNPNSVPLYAILNLCIICSPVTFFAFIYLLYARFVRHQKAISAFPMPKLSLFNEAKMGKWFVWIDVATFIVQCAGGGMQATGGSTREAGDKIFLVGIILQGILFIFFMSLVIITHVRLVKYQNDSRACRNFFLRLYWAAVFLIIRTIFRSAEMAQGYGGELYTNEIWLFVLDALPLCIAIGVFAPFWPAKYAESRGTRIGSSSDISMYEPSSKV